MIDLIPYAAVDAAVYFGVALSLWLSFRVLRYPDLALEQLFVLGAALFVDVIRRGFSAIEVIPILFVVAIVLGGLASVLRRMLGINAILVSLLAAYLYYSLTLTLLGKPNVSLGDSVVRPTLAEASIVAAATCGGLALAVAGLMATPLGLRIVACGSNWQLAARHRLQPLLSEAIGLSAAFLCALAAGALSAWRTHYVDVGSGSGLLLVAIFVVLVTRGVQRRVCIWRNAIVLLVALIAYLVVLQVAMHLGLPSHWLSGAKAIALLLVIVLLPSDARNEFRFSG